MTASARGRSTSDQVLRWIGDLDHPFYSDERNRHVWYEASAIAFQLLFLGSYYMAGAILWVLGADAMLPVLMMFVPTFLTAIVFQTHLKRNSAEYWPGKNDFVRRRGQVGILAGLFFLSGLVRATFDLQQRAADGSGAESFVDGTGEGMLAGLLVGPIVAAAVIIYRSRKAAAEDEGDEW